MMTKVELTNRQVNLILASLKACYNCAPVGDLTATELIDLYVIIKSTKKCFRSQDTASNGPR